jgi:hypothetical protein
MHGESEQIDTVKMQRIIQPSSVHAVNGVCCSLICTDLIDFIGAQVHLYVMVGSATVAATNKGC